MMPAMLNIAVAAQQQVAVQLTQTTRC
jgi:hypothetical protein